MVFEVERVEKSAHGSREERYTFGPFYPADQLDGHGEFTSADTLQRAVWAYADRGDRTVRLQHRPNTSAGKIVELACWPTAYTATLTTPGVEKAARRVTFPAGTAYAGVKWQPWAFELVKSGKLRGLSMGGSARRARGVVADFDERAVRKALGEPEHPEGDLVTKYAGADPASHSYADGPGARCLFCSHSQTFHEQVDGGLTKARAYTRSYSAQPTINTAQQVVDEHSKIGQARDPRQHRTWVRRRARELGHGSLVDALDQREQARTVASQHDAWVSQLVAAATSQASGAWHPSVGEAGFHMSGRGADRFSTDLVSPETPQQPSTGRADPRGVRELLDGSPPRGTSAEGAPIQPRRTGAWNQGGGHGQPVHAPKGHLHDRGGGRGYRPAPMQVAKAAADPLAVPELASFARTDADFALLEAYAPTPEQVAKAAAFEPEEPDFPAPKGADGRWLDVDPALYDAYARGELDFAAVRKAVADIAEPSAADVGAAWLDALNDPKQAEAASADYAAALGGQPAQPFGELDGLDETD